MPSPSRARNVNKNSLLTNNNSRNQGERDEILSFIKHVERIFPPTFLEHNFRVNARLFVELADTTMQDKQSFGRFKYSKMIRFLR